MPSETETTRNEKRRRKTGGTLGAARETLGAWMLTVLRADLYSSVGSYLQSKLFGFSAEKKVPGNEGEG